MKIGDVATVRSGLVLSRKASKTPSQFCYQALNLRSIAAKGYIECDDLDVYYAKQSLPEEYLSQSGDVIVRLTDPYTAVLIDSKTEGIVISSNFAVIRADKTALLPGYLYWLLNSAQVKHQIYENATSNMLGAVKMGFFTDYNLPELPLEQQGIIANLYQLAQREQYLLKRLGEQKEALYQFTINQIHKQMAKEKK